MLFLISSRWTPTAPGYSATLNPLSPRAVADRSATSVNPLTVITTLGMPAFSQSTAGLTAAGVQVPHPPLPDIMASHPFSLANAAIRAETSRWYDGVPESVDEGNSV